MNECDTRTCNYIYIYIERDRGGRERGGREREIEKERKRTADSFVITKNMLSHKFIFVVFIYLSDIPNVLVVHFCLV
jgi:hypothetical protein